MSLKLFDKTKKEKKKKLKFKELYFPNTQISFLQIVLKICNTLSFLSLSFSFLLYKIPFKNVIVCVIFWNQYPNEKAAELTV